MTILRYLWAFTILATSLTVVQAAGIEKSGQNDIFDNPFIATGFNPNTGILTGYVSALRTSPGRTDECKFVFFGRMAKSELLPVLLKNAVKTGEGDAIEASKASKGQIVFSTSQQKLVVDTKDLPGDCEWIFQFIGEPKILQNGKLFSLTIQSSTSGDWNAVSVIGSKRAYFHRSADAKSKGKAFIVSGDLVYVYDDKPD